MTLGSLGNPVADLAGSTRTFLAAAGEFFNHLTSIGWPAFVVALLFLLAMQLARARAWQNVLRAAYPGERISYVKLSAAYLAGAGINAIIPAHAGDVTKVYLAKQQIRGSSYPAVTSSFLVQTVFDTSAGILVSLYALTQGLLPLPPELPRIPAFEISYWAEHPQLLLFANTVLIIAGLITISILARRAEKFWQRVKQGLIILRTPSRYFREVFSWQGLGWLCRFGAFWFLLDAFQIGGSVGNVMLVMSVQAIANIIPLTPGGAGAQQALLIATLEGPSRAAILSYSVGTQIAMAVWSVVLGFAALLLVFRTTDWRGLIHIARRAGDESAEAEADAAAKNGESGRRSEAPEGDGSGAEPGAAAGSR